MNALALVALAAACVLGRSDVRRGRLETLARQPRDVEVDVDAGILAYASNEKRLKQKRRIARTLGGAIEMAPQAPMALLGLLLSGEVRHGG